MNPFAWRQEHQVALVLGAILGAVILEVIGFMYRGLNYGTIGSGLWSASTARWAILGACIVYLRRADANPTLLGVSLLRL